MPGAASTGSVAPTIFRTVPIARFPEMIMGTTGALSMNSVSQACTRRPISTASSVPSRSRADRPSLA